MTIALAGTEQMARKKVVTTDKPIGPLLLKNFARLGYVDMVPRSAEIARLVTEKTGKPISRQRISAIINAVRVEPDTIAQIAKGLGLKVDELLRDD